MRLEEISRQLTTLLANQKSLYIASVDSNGNPHSSTSPFLVYDQKIYLFLSELSLHCQNILNKSKLSVLIIQDESASKEIFARSRASWTVTYREISRENQGFDEILEEMTTKLGPTVQMLKSLKDFHLFELEPKMGRLILGFGKAFEIEGFKIDPKPIGPN